MELLYFQAFMTTQDNSEQISDSILTQLEVLRVFKENGQTDKTLTFTSDFGKIFNAWQEYRKQTLDGKHGPTA